MSAPALEEVTLGRVRRPPRAPRKRRVPLEGILETTYRCNLNCVHCYVNKPAADADGARRRAAPRAAARVSWTRSRTRAPCSVLLTGGEVLVRPDFEPLYRHCLQKGLLVTVFTNGTEVTETHRRPLRRAIAPTRSRSRLYGMTKETYERVTRVPGSFEKCLAGIRRLHARGLPLKLKTMALVLERPRGPGHARASPRSWVCPSSTTPS